MPNKIPAVSLLVAIWLLLLASFSSQRSIVHALVLTLPLQRQQRPSATAARRTVLAAETKQDAKKTTPPLVSAPPPRSSKTPALFLKSSSMHSVSAYEEAVSRPSKVVYGSSNEHVNSEKLILKALKKRARVLTICGGGDNYLSLLADEDSVESVTCVDMNPFQLALAQLKLVLACSEISTEEIINFLGMNQTLDCKRLEVYEKYVEPELPDAVAKLFREHLMYEIEMGIAQFGGEINSFRYILRELKKLGFPSEDLWENNINVEKFRKICRAGIGTPEGVGRAAFMDDAYPEIYRKQWKEVVLPKFYDVLFQAVTDSRFEKTFNKAIMLKGKYDMDTLPEWLLPSVRERLRKRKDLVTFVNSPIDEVQVQDGKKYDMINTSNIFDWIEVPVGAKILTSVAENLLAPEGCMLIRMAFSDTHDLTQQVPNVRNFDQIKPEQLGEVDYSHFWFRNPSGFAILTRSRPD